MRMFIVIVIVISILPTFEIYSRYEVQYPLPRTHIRDVGCYQVFGNIVKDNSFIYLRLDAHTRSEGFLKIRIQNQTSPLLSDRKYKFAIYIAEPGYRQDKTVHPVWLMKENSVSQQSHQPNWRWLKEGKGGSCE